MKEEGRKNSKNKFSSFCSPFSLFNQKYGIILSFVLFFYIHSIISCKYESNRVIEFSFLFFLAFIFPLFPNLSRYAHIFMLELKKKQEWCKLVAFKLILISPTKRYFILVPYSFYSSKLLS